jgi:hypothetical protein
MTFSNQGYVDLRSLTSLPEGMTFSNQGSVDLRSLTSLPEGMTFSNQGYVDLSSLTSLPEGMTFSNQGYVDLSSLTPDETNAGSSRRNLFVVLQNDELKIQLGCFWGNEKEAITAIAKKYNGKDAKAYIDKIESAFAKARKRYAAQLSIKSTT